jgi:hypothetical protein
MEGKKKKRISFKNAFCVNYLINCALESTEEFVSLEFLFYLRNGGMRVAFQSLYMVIKQNVWLEHAKRR